MPRIVSNGNKTRLGVILSAGGSAFSEAARIAAPLPLDFCVVTDRECGAEARCRELAIPVTRIVETDRRRFSRATKEHFSRSDVNAVLLHFSRLISSELFWSIPCCNIHPALLPAFPGLGAVKQAWSAGVRFIGATLHFVDETVDMGQIIAQTVTPIPPNADLASCERLSFLQKTFLTLVLFELLIGDRLKTKDGRYSFAIDDYPNSAQANPARTYEILIKGFEALRLSLERDGVPGAAGMTRTHEQSTSI
jgi:phosphoribosylglycinamide formyltransferase-1